MICPIRPAKCPKVKKKSGADRRRHRRRPPAVVPDDKPRTGGFAGGLKGIRSDARDRPRSRRRVIRRHLNRSAEPKVPSSASSSTRSRRRRWSSDCQRTTSTTTWAGAGSHRISITLRLHVVAGAWKKVQTGLSGAGSRASPFASSSIAKKNAWRFARRTTPISTPSSAPKAGRLADRRASATSASPARSINGNCSPARTCLLSDDDAASLAQVIERNLPWSVTSGKKASVDARGAVHDLHLTQEATQTRLLDPADDAGGAAAVPGRPHLSPHRFDDAQRRSALRLASDPRDVRRRLPTLGRHATKVKNAQGARGDPPDGVHQRDRRVKAN